MTLAAALPDHLDRAALVVFWNPRCGYCQRMHHDLLGWEAERTEAEPRMVLVSTGTEQEIAAGKVAPSPMIVEAPQAFAPSTLPSHLIPSAAKVDWPVSRRGRSPPHRSPGKAEPSGSAFANETLTPRSAARRSGRRSRRSRRRAGPAPHGPARSAGSQGRGACPAARHWAPCAAPPAGSAPAPGPARPMAATLPGPLRDLHDDRGQRRQHRRGDQAVHRPRCRRDPGIVGGDRGQHLLGQLAPRRPPAVPGSLDVEHQVEPQHGQQEARAGRHEGVHRDTPPTTTGLTSPA